MDRKLPETAEIQHLIRLSEAARSCLESEATALRRKLDVPSRIRGSLKDHPLAWLFGSLGSGVAASLMFRRRPVQATKRRGITGTLLGLTLTAARPLAKIWLDGQLKQWAAGAPANLSSNRLNSNPPASKSF